MHVRLARGGAEEQRSKGDCFHPRSPAPLPPCSPAPLPHNRQPLLNLLEFDRSNHETDNQ